MKCRHIRRLLSAKIDGEVSSEMNGMLEAHLLQCISCRREWEMLQREDALLKGISWENPGEVFWKNYIERLKARQYEQCDSGEKPIWKIAIGLAIAASLLICLSLISWPAKTPIKSNIPTTAAKEDVKNEKVTLEYEKISTKKAVQNEKTALPDPLLEKDGNRYAMSLLKELGPMAGQYLSSLVRNTRKEIPQTWLEALVVINDTSSFNTLVELAQINKYRNNVLPLLGRTGRKEAIPILLKSLCNHSDKQAVIEGLKNMKSQATGFLIDLAYSSDYSQAKLAIEMLGQLDDHSVLPHLLHLWQNRDLRKSILDALVTLRSPDSSYFFMKLAQQKEYRKEAYQTLSHFHEPAVFQFLISQLYHEETRKLALQTLKHFRDPNAIPYILDILQHSTLRKEGIEALSLMPPEKVVPYLIAMLDRPALKRTAYHALKKLTNQDFGIESHRWVQWFKQV